MAYASHSHSTVKSTAVVKGFGCRPGVSGRPGGGRRPKASEEGTRGKLVGSWPAMGIWLGRGGGWRNCAAYSELGISGIIPSAGLFRLRLGGNFILVHHQ